MSPVHGMCVPGGPNSARYRSRQPEQSLLYRTVVANLEPFFAIQRVRGRSVPRFVERELRVSRMRRSGLRLCKTV